MAAKTLHDIEQHARELAGGEFEVVLSPPGKSVWVRHREAPPKGREADRDFLHEASFNRTGSEYLYIDVNRPVNYERAARFVSLCSELDTWIKGDSK